MRQMAVDRKNLWHRERAYVRDGRGGETHALTQTRAHACWSAQVSHWAACDPF